MDDTKTSLHILIVEDNEVNRDVTRFMLQRLGHTYALASHGAEALNICHKEQFDVVLMDCQMPVMDGFETTRRIRAGEGRDVHRVVPVLALTAGLVPHHLEHCSEAGMDAILSKPLMMRALADGLKPYTD